ncbi:MAG TPA: T9SS type A sorting domain-containing protein, partial [Bacteroidia bacterium]|nr:T9SS type A sorting domain-containing protein [Bacteroidia bacterium]
YQVERSTDGVHFTTVGEVSAKGISTYSYTDQSAPLGEVYYRVESIGNSGTQGYTSVVKVSLGANASPSVAVYPNPVRGGHISISLSNLSAGSYTVRLISMNGQEVIRSVISHSGGSSVQGMNIPKTLSGGVYKLEVLSPSKDTYTSKVIVE